MAEIRWVTPEFAVAAQLEPADIAAVREAGFVALVANRPDAESPGQPSHAELEAAARLADLDYVVAPFAGMPPAAAVTQLRAATASAKGPVLAFCRSGTRSITAWALGQQAAGDRSRDELVQLAREAGYDLDPVLPR